MMPLAPARFSTTTCCPSASESFGAIVRAATSVAPPAGKGTMKRTAFTGQDWASTGVLAAAMHSNPQHKNSGKLRNAQDRFDRIENSSLGTMVPRLIIRQNAQAALLARPLKYFHKILQDLEIFRGVNGFLEAGFDGQVTLTRMALSEPPRGRLFAGGPGFFHRRVSARPDRVEIQHGAFAFGHAEVRGIRGLSKKSAGCMDVQFRLVILVTVTDVMHA